MNGKGENSGKLSAPYEKLKKKYSGESELPSAGTGGEMSEDKLSALLSAAGSFGADNEKLYTYYRDMYSDSASKAAENAYGLASSHTGGYGNTYAVSAARNAYDKIMNGFYDKLYDIKGQNIKTVTDFAESAAKLGDYSYYEALGADMSGKKLDDDMGRAIDAAKYGDYSLLEAMGIDTASAKNSDQLNTAVKMAEYGDYSRLEEMGVDTSSQRYSGLLQIAEKMAEYGDYSGLEALGIQTQALNDEKKLEKALALAKYGDYSLLGDFSDNIAAMKTKIPAAVQKGAEAAYQNGGYGSLNAYLERQIGYGQINASEKRRILELLTL